ncbi:MAG: transposase [Bacteroidota bacterium]|nr:transposase [Bacteroidota bacterium]
MCKVRLGYSFTYLYAAVAPATGKLITLLLPDMTKASFALFVKHFKEQTRKVHGTHSGVLIGDKAGSHQSSICEQNGIYFEPLPTACPELNPVEHFFEELRRELSNRVFTSITTLENYLCTI